MPQEEDFYFSFASNALPADTFMVSEFKGVEGLSTLYEFDIMIYSLDPEIDLKAVLQSPATLTIVPEGEEERKIHGIPASLEQLHELDEFTYYRLNLVPRLWLADQHHENMLFLDKKVPEVIEEILKQVGLTSQDYELKLTGNYQPWEYICQYNETDFDFISRWMEKEGIYYYFDQSGDTEKLIITDSSTAHQPIEGEAVLYSPPDQPTGSVFEQVQEFACRQQILPKKVILKDYNYRKPSLELKGEADVDSDGRGNVYIYGEHFKTPEEGNALAKIRSEELLCREQVFYGLSTVSPFHSGYLFELDEHYRDSYNQKYLLTEIIHQGVLAEAFAMTGRVDRITDLESPTYENRFTCILEEPQFRPERKTVKPRIDGTLNAKVDAAGDGQYAEIDEEGRYKVILPFDQSDASDGKASRFVRMAQPYAGADYGMHFPLHKGVEVLLTFIDGDPDRPIISNSVPNPETMSPITSNTQTMTMIRTGGGNQLHSEDQDGSQLFEMYSPTGNSSVRVGGPNQDGDEGIELFTERHLDIRVLGQESKSIGVNMLNFGSERQWQHIEGDRKLEVTGNENVVVDQNQDVHVKGAQSLIVDQSRSVYVGLGEDYVSDLSRSLTVNGPNVIETNNGVFTHLSNAGETHNITGQMSYMADTETYTVNGPRTITVTGAQTRTIASENNFYQAAKNSFTSGAYFSGEFSASMKMALALALEIYVGIKIELKPSVGIELAGIKIGQTVVNMSKDHIVIKEGKLVLGEKILLDNKATRLFL